MNEKLNIQDLIDLLAEKHGMSKKNADSFVKEFFQLIEEALEKDKYVKIKGLGAFKLIDVESRESVNVNTGERFEIQGHTKVSFTPEPALKDIINKPFAHFETVVLNEGTVLEDTPVDSGSEEDEDTEQKVEDVVPEVVAGSTVEIPEIAEKNDSPVESEPVEETVAPVETVASEEVNEERVEVIKTAGPAESSAMKYFIAIVALVVLLCAGAVAYLYYPDWFDGLSAEQPVEETAGNEAGNEAGNTALMDSVGVKDSVAIAVKDTVSKKLIAEPVIKQQEAPVAVKQPVAAATSASQPKKQKKVEYVPDSTNYTIAGTQATYTIKPGETLTRVALRFYGTKALYPYIVKHNPDVIKKPDNVPAGTTIKIPKLVKKQ
ncbi:HU family DNA-binding protein [Bacteroides stercoris]|nr:HU family DNA-binding protein [Bacteroides stercoris]